jgi:aspartyl-tRNA(Asn)/glutamyl-tRNA(Gln) amidotransferase subunit A
MNSLAFATIKELRNKLEKKEITSKELLQFSIERFKKYDNKIGSALEILAGIPGILKDNICQEDRIASCASKMLENFRSTYDATIVKRLKEQGALLIGRANMDEFAMGSSNEYSAFKKVHNPWDLERVSGGSSGGSVAAVSAGFVPWSLGSETGGSVRLPAAFCGVVGLKPTYGYMSRYGLIAYASSLDQIGVITRTVADNALVFSAMAGHDPKDSSTMNVKDFKFDLTGKLKEGLKIGIVENTIEAEGLDQEVYNSIKEAASVFEKLGAKIKYVKVPSMDYSAATYFIVSRAEAASNLARFDGVRYGYRNKQAKTLNEMYSKTRYDGFGQEVRLRILVGNYVLSAGHASDYYENAKKVQKLMYKEFSDIFKEVDVLIIPTQSAPSFKFGAFANNKLQMDLQDYFTAFANLIGIPALSIPCGFTKNNLPLGLQIVGPSLSENLLFNTAYAYEQETQWHKKHPQEFE